MFRRTFIASASVLALSRAQAVGTPWVAPANIMEEFERFDVLTSPAYTDASTGALGTVYLLKSDAKASNFSWDPSTIQDKLQLILFMSGKTLGKRLISSQNYQRLDETGAGARNQCVAFAKAMTNAGTTTGWKKGTTMLSLFPNGRAPSQWQAEAMLQTGTMITTFGSALIYSNNTTNPHVAIVRNVVADSTGKILGVNVYNQNGMDRVSLNGIVVNVGDYKTTNPTGGTITKNFIPWSNLATTAVPLSMKNYSIVTN
jgi:hypothetical protein